MNSMNPKQIQDLQARAGNAERRYREASKERDSLRKFLMDLREDPSLSDALRKKIQRELNKTLI